jgi:uncharacterized protein YndB with AHSA1/START domain
MIDVIQQINSVRRQVGTRVIETGTARTVTVSQTYNATVDDLWDACTSAERIPRWFLPISGDLRVGGRYQLEGNAGGTIERCDPPHSFTATWEFGGGVTWIEVRLTSEPDGRARLTLEHTGMVEDSQWAEFGPGAVGVGWDSGLLGLARHLDAPDTAVKPADAMAWLVSDEGKEFVRLSSEGWCAASIEAGTAEDEARAARDRTTAAYTAGAPEAAPA